MTRRGTVDEEWRTVDARSVRSSCSRISTASCRRAERAEAEAHLEACGSCSKRYRFEERLWRYVTDCCSGEPMPAELKERLLALRAPLL